MAAPIYYTADMVRALPEDGNRYEVVHGELLVTPVPGLLTSSSSPALRPSSPSISAGIRSALRSQLIWHPSGAAEPFVLKLEELFRPL
jgi:hypothetical protein